MSLLQVRVSAVGAVAQAVISQGDNLVLGLVSAHRPLAGVLAGAVLIDVVTDTHDDVDALVIGHIAVGREEAALPVGAGSQRDTQVLWGGVLAAVRCGCAPPARWHRSGCTGGDQEAVVVEGICL